MNRKVPYEVQQWLIARAVAKRVRRGTKKNCGDYALRRYAQCLGVDPLYTGSRHPPK